MSYLGTKPSNSPLTSELIPNSIITNAKINDVAATKLTGQVPDANAPSGSVIQVVHATTGTQITVSSSSYTATSLQVTINKQISGSTILIIVSPNVQTYYASAGGPAKAGGRVYETSASREIYDFQCVVRTYDGGDVNLVAPNLALQCVDTLAGTGNRTYRFDIKNITGADARLNIDTTNEATSHITAWEIAP